jgi:hypothetical protein
MSKLTSVFAKMWTKHIEEEIVFGYAFASYIPWCKKPLAQSVVDHDK